MDLIFVFSVTPRLCMRFKDSISAAASRRGGQLVQMTTLNFLVSLSTVTAHGGMDPRTCPPRPMFCQAIELSRQVLITDLVIVV